MQLYGLKNCDTCRKAMKTLPNATFVDVRTDGVPSDVLERALAKFGDALVNTRSTTWRQLNNAERQKPAMTLLVENPSLMKRPLIERDGELFLSWSKDVQAALA
ncbi:MAG: arsenate reductase [Cognatishimia sp.]|uniref:ArsC/Spx/MgsR family protein n=1 Tax=Cognatishimia sp. TaxID=2211648 RepID=UPI003B8B4CE9